MNNSSGVLFTLQYDSNSFGVFGWISYRVFVDRGRPTLGESVT